MGPESTGVFPWAVKNQLKARSRLGRPVCKGKEGTASWILSERSKTQSHPKKTGPELAETLTTSTGRRLGPGSKVGKNAKCGAVRKWEWSVQESNDAERRRR